MRNVAFSVNPVYIPLNPLLGAIIDLGLRIADLLYRFALSFFKEQPRRKQRGIKRKILNAPRGGEFNPCPPQAD